MADIPEEEQQRGDRVVVRETPRTGSRGTVTTRPSREAILQAYAAEDAQRAEDARQRARDVSAEYAQNTSRAATRAAQRAELLARQQDQRVLERQLEQDAVIARQRAAQQQARNQLAHQQRAVEPLSSQESQDRTRTWKENYEYQRATRDPLMRAQYGRGGNREVIDGRGSIDSRAFNEHQVLVGYSIDERDRHDPELSSVDSSLRWHSRAGQGFEGKPDGIKRFQGAPTTRRGKPTMVNRELDRKKRMPFAAKFLIGLAVVAFIVAIALVFFVPAR